MSEIIFAPSHPLTDQERVLIAKHLWWSECFEAFWKQGDAIIEAIYAHKRIVRKSMDPVLKCVVRGLRKLGKYEPLRSSLEGLLYDQVEQEQFCLLSGGYIVTVSLMHVYFSKHLWLAEPPAAPRVSLDSTTESLTETDLSFLICYFMRLEALLTNVMNHAQDQNKDRIRKKKPLASIRNVAKDTVRVLEVAEKLKKQLMIMLQKRMASVLE